MIKPITKDCMQLLFPNGLAKAYQFVLKAEQKSLLTQSNKLTFKPSK